MGRKNMKKIEERNNREEEKSFIKASGTKENQMQSK